MPATKSDKFQLQISEIDNGILVQVPGETQTNPANGQQLIVKLPQTFYVEDVDMLCQTLQKIWPRAASKIELLKK